MTDMKEDRYRSFVAVPAFIPARLALGVLTIVKWILTLTCTAVVLFVLWQIAIVLNDVSHHRTPKALRVPHSRKAAPGLATIPKRS